MDGQGIRIADGGAAACDPWDNQAAEALVSLETIAPFRYRSRYGDGNLNGRSYGGQILGQAMMAATLSAPEDRPAAMLQLLFLRGADPARRISFDAQVLQDGKRFSSRHVVGHQGDGRTVLSAQATFCAPQPGPRHAAPFAASEDPDSLPDLSMIPDALMAQLRPLGPYSQHIKPSMDFRIPEIDRQLSAASAGPRYARSMPVDTTVLDQMPAAACRGFPRPGGGVRLSLGLVAQLLKRRQPPPRPAITRTTLSVEPQPLHLVSPSVFT